MKAIPAIYHEGQIQFIFSLPDHAGPVSVLVIFPELSETGDVEEGNPESSLFFEADDL